MLSSTKIFLMTLTSVVALSMPVEADIIITLHDPGNGSTTITFSGGVGGVGIDPVFRNFGFVADTAADSFIVANTPDLPVNSGSGSLDIGGVMNATFPWARGDLNGAFSGAQSYFQIPFASEVPLGSALSDLNGDSINIPTWTYEKWIPGTYTNLTDGTASSVFDGHQITLVITAVPEPSSLMICLAATCSFTLLRRRISPGSK
jgi:hypothetical protein